MHIKNIQNMLIFLVGRISFEFSCVVSLPDFSLPAAADLPGVVDEHASLLQVYQRRRPAFSPIRPGGFGGYF